MKFRFCEYFVCFVCLGTELAITFNILCPLSGLLPFQIPYVEFSGEDYSNSHDAVGCTPPPPSLTSDDTWYKWYGAITPDEEQVAKVKKTYKAYLK